MKQIKLQSLSLFNFKGISKLELQFQDQSFICGENGTGKTTVFDAFTWCLFGKDSSGRSDSNFNICPLDSDGKAILKREPSVECVINVDGSAIKFGRRYCEVWTKPRGTAQEVLTGHKTEFFINDVKQATKKDYDLEVAAVLPEDLFKIVTNPFYFTSLRPDVQKEMLLQMAGDVTDQDVAALKPEFVNFLANLAGKPLATFLKEIAAKKRAIKNELDTIPASIETAQRLMPEDQNWNALEKELKDKKARVAEIDAQIADASKVAQAENERKIAIQKQIGEKQTRLEMRKQELKSEGMGAYNEAKQRVFNAASEITSLKCQKDLADKDVERLQNISARMGAQLDTLRAEYRTINAQQLQFPEGAFVCPTCKRPLEPEDIEAKQQELVANFNRDKAAKLEENRRRGGAMKQDKDNVDAEMKKAIDARDALAGKIEVAEAQYKEAQSQVPEVASPEDKVKDDPECITLTNEISELKNQLTMEPNNTDSSDLISGKSILSSAIETLIDQIAKKEQRAKAEAEVLRLEERRVAANQELADLESAEFLAADFQKSKDAELLKRINGMFQMVSFSFVDEQLNGGEKLTCVCTVNGTPYPDVNNAGKINAGLDIINAICRNKGITAPIFIDNRESVNTLIPTLSQVINLVVSKDQTIVQH